MDDMTRLETLIAPALPPERIRGLRAKERPEKRRGERRGRHPDEEEREERPDAVGAGEGNAQLIGYGRSGLKAMLSSRLRVSV